MTQMKTWTNADKVLAMLEKYGRITSWKWRR